MAYTKTPWVDGTTPGNAANFNKIEQGIADADAAAAAAAAAAVAAQATADGAVPKALVDAKGDLLVASGDNVLARLPGGADGQVLTRDAAQALGLKWAAPAGGADLSYDGDWVAGTYQDGDVVVRNGIAFLCVGGPTTQAPDIAPWGPAALAVNGDELAYAEIAANASGTQTTDATAGTILTLPTITLDGATPIIIDVAIPLIQHSALSYVIVSVWDGATQIGRIGSIYAPSAGNGESFYERLRLTPAAGAHSYTIRVHGGSAGTWTVVAGGGAAGNYLAASARITRILPAPLSYPAAPLTVPSYGTTLPASPSDGQEAILVDSVANPTYQWRFRYNAGSSSPYKWEFVGGTALRAGPVGSFAMSANAVTDFTGGPTATIPRAGDYECLFGCGMQQAQAGATVNMNLWLNIGGTQSDMGNIVGTAQYASGYIALPMNALGVAASAAVKLQVRSQNSASMTASLGWFQIRPVRVA